MKPWQAPKSEIAPIVIGANALSPGSQGVLDAFDAAVGCVPGVETTAWVGPLKRNKQQAMIGLMSLPGDAIKPYHRRVRLVLRRDGESGQVSQHWWYWEASLAVLNSGSAAPAIDADQVTAVLDVTRFAIRSGIMIGAWQLALLRHLWISALRASDPGVQVFGGQHDWDMNWITPATPVADN